MFYIYTIRILNPKNYLYKYSFVFFKMKPTKPFKDILRAQGYSTKTIEKLWKWYDYSEKKGVASF